MYTDICVYIYVNICVHALDNFVSMFYWSKERSVIMLGPNSIILIRYSLNNVVPI